MMRKNLLIFKEFFHKNKIKSLALVVIITCTCIIMVNTVAEINYRYKSLSCFEGEELKNADYVRVYEQLEYTYTEKYANDNRSVNVDSFKKDYSEIVKSDLYHQIEQLPAVDKVYSYYDEDGGYSRYNDVDMGLYFANEDTYKYFGKDLSAGCWFWETEQKSEYPNVVLCGSIFENTEIGSDIDIIYNTDPYKVHVIGKIAPPYQYVSINGIGGSALRSGNLMFFVDNEFSYNFFGSQIKRYPTNAIVQYKSTATEEDIKECRDFYRSFVEKNGGSVLNIQNAYRSLSWKLELEYTLLNEGVENLINVNLIYCSAAMLVTVILAILMVRGKRKEHNIYCLCGCSKMKAFWLSFAGIATITFISGVLVSIYMIVRSSIISSGILNIYRNEFVGVKYFIHKLFGKITDIDSIGYIFDWKCYGIIWGYLLIITVISSIIPFIMVMKKKMTLMTLYKQK